MLLPDRHNFTMWRGATFRSHLTMYADDSETVPRNLTGCSATLVVKDAPSGTVLFTLTSSGDGITLGGTAGTIDLYISASDTEGYAWTNAFYELFLIESNGDKDALLYGGLSIKSA